jgi:hypothetical protein
MMVLTIDTWNFLKKRSLSLMEKTLAHEKEAFGGPTFHLQAQRLSPSAKTFP